MVTETDAFPDVAIDPGEYLAEEIEARVAEKATCLAARERVGQARRTDCREADGEERWIYAFQAGRRGFEPRLPLHSLASESSSKSANGSSLVLTCPNKCPRLPANPLDAFVEYRKAMGVTQDRLSGAS